MVDENACDKDFIENSRNQGEMSEEKVKDGKGTTEDDDYEDVDGDNEDVGNRNSESESNDYDDNDDKYQEKNHKNNHTDDMIYNT